jgi:putative salt-induced outer membrane protein YdiY
MKTVFAALLFVIAFTPLAHADTVVFKNGDKLSGTLVRVHGDDLDLKSDILGNVTIDLGKVQSYSADAPAVLLGKDQKSRPKKDRTIRGQVALDASGNWQVTSNGASQTVSAADLAVILPADTYHALAEVRAMPWQGWKGSINFGYAIQQGDQQTHTLNTTVAALRERSTDLLFTPHFRTNYALTMLLSKAQQNATAVTSNTLTTSLREDYLFTQRNFVFGVGELDHITAQGLYLRQIVGGGFGHDLVSRTRSTLSLLGGFNYIHERFIVGPSDKSIQALLGEHLAMQMNSRVHFEQQFTFYPDLEHGNRFRWDTSANLGLQINRHFAANAGVMISSSTSLPPAATKTTSPLPPASAIHSDFLFAGSLSTPARTIARTFCLGGWRLNWREARRLEDVPRVFSHACAEIRAGSQLGPSPLQAARRCRARRAVRPPSDALRCR